MRILILYNANDIFFDDFIKNINKIRYLIWRNDKTWHKYNRTQYTQSFDIFIAPLISSSNSVTLMSLINVTVLLVFWAFLPPGTVLITDGTIIKIRYFGARYVWSCVILRTGCDPLTPVYMNWSTCKQSPTRTCTTKCFLHWLCEYGTFK